MGLFKKVLQVLGFGNHDLHEDNKEHDDENGNNNLSTDEESNHYNHSNLHRKGFSVPAQVPVDRSHQIGPVFLPCIAGSGGVQGFGWYSRRLKIDEDGDVADEFLEEIFTETTSNDKQFPRFEVKLNTKSARARNLHLSRDGTIRHSVEFRGRLHWV